jgi:hypothetical protein
MVLEVQMLTFSSILSSVMEVLLYQRLLLAVKVLAYLLPVIPFLLSIVSSADGTWSLDVVDTFTGSDDGCLQAWALLFNSVTFVDPGQRACGGGGTATLSFSPTSPGSFTIGGADLNRHFDWFSYGWSFHFRHNLYCCYRRKF